MEPSLSAFHSSGGLLYLMWLDGRWIENEEILSRPQVPQETSDAQSASRKLRIALTWTSPSELSAIMCVCMREEEKKKVATFRLYLIKASKNPQTVPIYHNKRSIINSPVLPRNGPGCARCSLPAPCFEVHIL